jgi:uncharacterized protein
MGYNYNVLLKVQEIDISLSGLKKNMEEIPRSMEVLKKTNIKEQSEVANVKNSIKELTLKKRQFEKDVEEKNAHMLKLKNQRGLVKTNEEYRAIEKEIAFDQDFVNQREEAILETMEHIEKEEKNLRDKEGNLKIKDAEIKTKEQEAKQQLQKLKERSDSLDSDREKLIREIEPVLLKLYNKIYLNKKDYAIVPVLDNKVCGGCRMGLTADVRNEVQKNKIVRCDNCSRILYWKIS